MRDHDGIQAHMILHVSLPTCVSATARARAVQVGRPKVKWKQRYGHAFGSSWNELPVP